MLLRVDRMEHAQRLHEMEDLEAELRSTIRAMRELSPDAYGLVMDAINDEFLENYHLRVSQSA